ncbi:MAG: hypothetical protein HXX08_14810, partial [Chloroflexi bacterium]|nr:hypothetical protein [Chloroflexota bacterium]
IGKDKSYIENRLALLKAPEDVREMVARRPDTLRAAREISHLENPEERQILINGVLSREITTEGIRERLRHSPGKLPEGEYRVVISIIRKWQTTAGQDQVIDGELLGYVRQLQNDLTRLEEQLSRVNGEI